MCKQTQSISVHLLWRMPVQIAVTKAPSPTNIAMIDSGGIGVVLLLGENIVSQKLLNDICKIDC